MFTYFISDLHLSAHRPDITAAFYRFLKDKAPQAQALYILGDLFEYWIGDDDTSPFNREMITAFNDFSKLNIPMYFMHGNRDFLIGKQFAKETHITLLKDPTIVNLYGKNVLLTHGDYLCTHDTSHQRFRRFTALPFVQWFYLNLPLKFRQSIAQKLRTNSKARFKAINAAAEKENISIADNPLYEVNAGAVSDWLTQYKVDTLIHGHTHKPGIHEFTLNGKNMKRIVLGDWGDTGSILEYGPNDANLFRY